MVRKHFYLTEEQEKFLKSLPGTMAEHLRKALDEYIEKKQNLNISASSSMKGGDYGSDNNISDSSEE